MAGTVGARGGSPAVRANPSLHLTFASPLRGLSPAGELKRWASASSIARSAYVGSDFPQRVELSDS